MRISGFDNAKGLCAGLMTVPQLSATLAAAAVALNLKMLSEDFFNAIVFLSLMTTLPVPTLVRYVIAHYHIQFQPADAIQKTLVGIRVETQCGAQGKAGQRYTDISV